MSLEVRREEAQAKRDAELARLDLPWPRVQNTKKPGRPTRLDTYLDAVYGYAAHEQWDELAKVGTKHPPLSLWWKPGMSPSTA
eukprot:5872504-Amphidinium_carterae.1